MLRNIRSMLDRNVGRCTSKTLIFHFRKEMYTSSQTKELKGMVVTISEPLVQKLRVCNLQIAFNRLYESTKGAICKNTYFTAF